jgi:hypothetical protein
MFSAVSNNKTESQTENSSVSYYTTDKSVSLDISSKKEESLLIQPDINLDKFSIQKESIFDKKGKGTILVKFISKNNTFYFFNNKKQNLGSFSIFDIIQYVISKMLNLDLEINSSNIIEMFVLKVVSHHDSNKNIIILKEIGESAFMNDAEMLIRLNNGLRIFAKDKLQKLTEKYDPKLKLEVQNQVDNLIVKMLHHTLKILTVISEKIKNDKTKKLLKESIIKYIIGVTYRISQIVSKQITDLESQEKQLKNTVNISLKIKANLNQKIDKLMQTVNFQNNKILKMSDKLLDQQFKKPSQYGGRVNKDNYDKTSSSSVFEKSHKTTSLNSTSSSERSYHNTTSFSTSVYENSISTSSGVIDLTESVYSETSSCS